MDQSANKSQKFGLDFGIVAAVLTMVLLCFPVAFILVFGETAAPDGKALYEKSCKTCHGVDGKGNPKMAAGLKIDPVKLDLTDKETTDKKDSDWAKTINDGAGKMKGYKDKMSKEEISAVVAHVRSLKK